MSDVVFMQKFFANIFGNEHQQDIGDVFCPRESDRSRDLSLLQIRAYLKLGAYKPPELSEEYKNVFKEAANAILGAAGEDIECDETTCERSFDFDFVKTNEGELEQQAAKRSKPKMNVKKEKNEGQLSTGAAEKRPIKGKGRKLLSQTALDNARDAVLKSLNNNDKNIAYKLFESIFENGFLLNNNGQFKGDAVKYVDRHMQAQEAETEQMIQFLEMFLNQLCNQNVVEREQYLIKAYAAFLRQLVDQLKKHNSFASDKSPVNMNDAMNEMKSNMQAQGVAKELSEKIVDESLSGVRNQANGMPEVQGALNRSNILLFVRAGLKKVGDFISNHKAMMIALGVLIVGAIVWFCWPVAAAATATGSSVATASTATAAAASTQAMSTALSVIPQQAAEIGFTTVTNYTTGAVQVPVSSVTAVANIQSIVNGLQSSLPPGLTGPLRYMLNNHPLVVQVVKLASEGNAAGATQFVTESIAASKGTEITVSVLTSKIADATAVTSRGFGYFANLIPWQAILKYFISALTAVVAGLKVKNLISIRTEAAESGYG